MKKKSDRFLKILPIIYFGIAIFGAALVQAQTREEKMLGDRLKFEQSGLWYYNDLEKAFETASKTEQPVLVVLRCIPCEACVKLDDDMLESNPTLQRLLKSFVRVRIVGTNGLDLSLFEYDTDQSFAVFFFNSDRTLYGRYGTRSDRTEWEGDVSVEGLGKALEKALTLHRNYPAIRESLIAKQASKPLFSSPEKIPALATKYTDKLDYQGNIVKSCIHCHQIGDAMREYYRTEQGKLPTEWLFPYPHPKIIGLILDPKECATVKDIASDSAAQRAGFQIGDRIELMESQPILSFADVQWVLHHVPSEGKDVRVSVLRGDRSVELKISLEPGWRAKEDISWRASTWPLRRMALGGMVLKPLTDEERISLSVDNDQMAMLVMHVGAFAPHDRAKQAGIIKGDILIEYDGRRDFVRETDLLAYAMNEVEPNREVPLRLRRASADGRSSEERVVRVATAK